MEEKKVRRQRVKKKVEVEVIEKEKTGTGGVAMEKQITEKLQTEQHTTGGAKKETGSATASLVKNGIIGVTCHIKLTEIFTLN